MRALQTYNLDLFFKSASAPKKVSFVVFVLMLTYSLIIKLVHLFLLKFLSQRHKDKFVTPHFKLIILTKQKRKKNITHFLLSGVIC
jgi:hypothetical protein